MPTYRRSQSVDVPADRVYDLVSDVSRLPRYFNRLTSATPLDGDRVETTAVIDTGDGQGEQKVTGQAWLRTDPESRSVQWGAPGENDYHGTMRVETVSEHASVVELEISTERPHDGIDAEIDATLERLVTVVSQES